MRTGGNRWHGTRPRRNRSTRPRVFCASLADVFEDWQGPILDHQTYAQCLIDSEPSRFVPIIPGVQELGVEERAAGWRPVVMDDVRNRLFKLIDATPNLDWLLLTKRPENIRSMWPAVNIQSQQQADDYNELGELFRRNVWLGTSVEDQKWANRRIPQLLKCRDLSPVLFLSCEPVVGPIDLTHVLLKESEAPELGIPDVSINCLRGWYGAVSYERAKIDWVITGGESGPGARPANPDWYRSLRDQCQSALIPFHFKQWGEWVGLNDTEAQLSLFAKSDHHAFDQETIVYRIGKKSAGRRLDGRFYDGFPQRSVV